MTEYLLPALRREHDELQAKLTEIKRDAKRQDEAIVLSGRVMTLQAKIESLSAPTSRPIDGASPGCVSETVREARKLFRGLVAPCEKGRERARPLK